MAFVSSTIASDLFTGTVAFEPLRITSKEVQERYNRHKEAHGERDRVKVAEICLDVLKSFNIPLEIQGLDVDRKGKEEVAYVVLDGRPKDKSLAYVYAKHLGRGYAAYVPFPEHYFEQKVRITVPKLDTGFDVRTFLCRHQVPAPYKWENTGDEYLLWYITPGCDGNLADRTHANTIQFVKSRLAEHVRSTVTGAEMLFHEPVNNKKDFVMPYSAAELFPDVEDRRSASTIGRAIAALPAPAPPRSILRVGAAPVDAARLEVEEQLRREERARRGISPSDALNWAKAGGSSSSGGKEAGSSSSGGKGAASGSSGGKGTGLGSSEGKGATSSSRGGKAAASGSSGGKGTGLGSSEGKGATSSSRGGKAAGLSSSGGKEGSSSSRGKGTDGGKEAGLSSSGGKGTGGGKEAGSSSPRKREISNDTYELREAEDGPRTRRTKRQINLEIQMAREDLAKLKRQGLTSQSSSDKGSREKNLEGLQMLIAVLEKEKKSAIDPAAPKSLDPAAPVFVPAKAPVSNSSDARSKIEQIDRALTHHRRKIAELEAERKMLEVML